MAKKYANAIKAGIMTIEQVQARWREEVRKMIEGE